MYEFLDRLIALAIPRVKDFRGLNPNGFDKSGNYNFGFNEQTVFPEVDGAAVTFQQGMNITMVTTARIADEGRELLRQFGFRSATTRRRTRSKLQLSVRCRELGDRSATLQGTTTWQQKPGLAKQKRREELVKKYAEIRRQLKKEKNFAALAKLPRDSSPTRSHNRCQFTGRSRAVLRKFKVSPHHAPRAGPGRQDPGLKKASW